MEILIDKSGRCTCTCGDRCILGRGGMEKRCTKKELEEAGYKTRTRVGTGSPVERAWQACKQLSDLQEEVERLRKLQKCAISRAQHELEKIKNMAEDMVEEKRKQLFFLANPGEVYYKGGTSDDRS